MRFTVKKVQPLTDEQKQNLENRVAQAATIGKKKGCATCGKKKQKQ